MCGRFDQNQTAAKHLSAFGWLDALCDSAAAPSYNVAPGSYRPVLHIADGQRRVDDLHWGYRSAWGGAKGLGIASCARLEKIRNGYWGALVTADAEGGMVDVHDRRPVALAPADAARWLDPALPPEQAEHLLRTAALGPDAFAWYAVGPAVNRAASEGPQLAQEQPAQGLL